MFRAIVLRREIGSEGSSLEMSNSVLSFQVLQGPQKLFRSGPRLKFFIFTACNYVICAECNYTFVLLN